jgi:hypothetical protein
MLVMIDMVSNRAKTHLRAGWVIWTKLSCVDHYMGTSYTHALGHIPLGHADYHILLLDNPHILGASVLKKILGPETLILNL